MEIIKRIDNAVNSNDPVLMKGVLEDAKEFILTHTPNYDLPEQWKVYDFFRLTQDEYKTTVQQLLDDTDKIPNNLLGLLNTVRELVGIYKNERNGFAKSIMLMAATVDTLEKLYQKEKQGGQND